MSNYKELLAERARLEEQLQAAFREERGRVLEEIMRKMAVHQITLAEIRGRPSPPVKAAAKYRDPSTGKEWSGRGKPPNWIKDAADGRAFS